MSGPVSGCLLAWLHLVCRNFQKLLQKEQCSESGEPSMRAISETRGRSHGTKGMGTFPISREG